MAVDKHKIWLISSIVIVILIIGFIFLYPNVKKGLAGQAFKVGTCNDPDSKSSNDPAQLLIKATTIKEAKQNEDHCKLKDGNLLLYEGICTNTGSIGFWPYNCSKMNKVPTDNYECVESVGACVNKNEVLTCTPSCVGKACGDNGCGGVCGLCGTGSKCQDNICKTKDNFLCTETDNGKDFTKKGTLYSYNFPDGKEDECDLTTGKLNERYCFKNEISTLIYTCPSGFKCQAGACISTAEICDNEIDDNDEDTTADCADTECWGGPLCQDYYCQYCYPPNQPTACAVVNGQWGCVECAADTDCAAGEKCESNKCVSAIVGISGDYTNDQKLDVEDIFVLQLAIESAQPQNNGCGASVQDSCSLGGIFICENGKYSESSTFVCSNEIPLDLTGDGKLDVEDIFILQLAIESAQPQNNNCGASNQNSCSLGGIFICENAKYSETSSFKC